MTPNEMLFSAAQGGDIPTARKAIADGADVNAPNLHGVTPLLEASGQEQFEMVRFLIENGANVDYTGMREGSPLMLACYMGQVELVRLYLEMGANVNLAMPIRGETALHLAVATGRTEVAKLLLDAGADPCLHVASNQVTDMFDGGVKLWGETPLHFAAAYGDEVMIEAMLSKGADRKATNVHGETPLGYAGRHKRPREIRNLLK